MKQITLAGLWNEINFGDVVIADCAEFLYKEQLDGNVLFDKLDLNLPSKISISTRIILKLCKIFSLTGLFFFFVKECYKRYYRKNISKNSNLIVLTGGGILKFKYQEVAHQLVALIEVAEKRKVPVVINAVGVECFDSGHIGCKLLRRAINKKIVKAITTRDDIELLENKWLQGNFATYRKLVADPAVWASEVYGVKKSIDAEIIGIGLIREQIFQVNGIDFSGEELINLYAAIIKKLEEQNIKYRLFTNGHISDFDFAVKLCSKLNRKELIAEIAVPKTATDLVQIISNFKGVIATRLHACIISYSLNIPAVGLVWNDKLSLFGKCTSYPERFIKKENFKAQYIVDRLQTALQECYNADAKQKYRMTIKDSIKEILQTI
jgi:polysaccharide pyruvyl transferase WcaK-like protein